MKYPPSANSARISEVFSSLQGEGLHAGERHIFIRFEECNIECVYCDEIHKKGEEISLADLMDKIMRLEKEKGPHAFVSLTGGEPLLYQVFLKPLLIQLKERGLRTYLETSGILWRALDEVIDWCDCIAMDMKTPSVTKEKNFDEEHRYFLARAKKKECFIKIVVSKDLILGEFITQMHIAADIAPEIPVVLMPLSADIEGHEDPELMEIMYSLQQIASKMVSNVKIIPRLHRILNIQ